MVESLKNCFNRYSYSLLVASAKFDSEMAIICLCFVLNKKIGTFMTYLLSIHNNWFARQQSRRNHLKMILSGILMMFEFMLFGGLFHLSLYAIEIGQMAFVAAVIVLSVAVCVKIIKNRKVRKKS